MALTIEHKDQLISALQNRLSIIANHALRERDPALQLEQLQQSSEQIEALVKSLRIEMPGDLRHYFAQMSYQKALDWLQHGK